MRQNNPPAKTKNPPRKNEAPDEVAAAAEASAARPTEARPSSSPPHAATESPAAEPAKPMAEVETPAAAAVNGGEGSSGGSFKIKDRRFWSRNEAKGADAPAAAATADDQAPVAAPTTMVPVAELVAAQEALAAKEARLQETLRQYKEALEEFERAKGRLRRDVDKEVAAGKRSLLADLLEVMDNLERALQATDGSASPDTALHGGVSMVRDLFMAKLEGLGVRRLPALGQPFDPSHFEALSMVPVTDPAQDGQVVAVVRDAYLLGDEVLRHGMVAVGKKS